MKNVVLIGMPGTGKSAVGRALAKRLHYTFLDADDLIREDTGHTLPEILRTEGIEGFLTVEGRVGEALRCEDTVIATGGSMVLSEKAMEHLKKNAVVVWLETPLSKLKERLPDELTDRGIAAPPGTRVEELYAEREPLYAQYADVVILSCEGETEAADRVEQVLHAAGFSL